MRNTWNFCPNCGAELEKVYESENAKQWAIVRKLKPAAIQNKVWHLVKKDETYNDWYERVITHTYGYVTGAYTRNRCKSFYEDGGLTVDDTVKYLIELDRPEVQGTQLYYEKWGK